eukprot:3811961-Prymnesium_polylepis.1
MSCRDHWLSVNTASSTSTGSIGAASGCGGGVGGVGGSCGTMTPEAAASSSAIIAPPLFLRGQMPTPRADGCSIIGRGRKRLCDGVKASSNTWATEHPRMRERRESSQLVINDVAPLQTGR